MKRYFKKLKLNKSYLGWISSYSLFLMILSFLKLKNYSKDISIGKQFYSPYTKKRWIGWFYDKRMNFPLKIIDIICKVRDDLKKLDFIIDYDLSPEEPYWRWFYYDWDFETC